MPSRVVGHRIDTIQQSTHCAKLSQATLQNELPFPALPALPALRALPALPARPACPALPAHTDRMIRLLAVDIDGTLLDTRGRVPDAHRDALVEAASRGIEIALVTGRSFHFSRPIADLLPVPLTLT